jgi:hypothetical protein
MRFTPSLLAIVLVCGSTSLAQAPRTPTETMREFYRMMREKKYREAFGISIYRAAIEGLSAQEYDDLKPDFDKMAVAVSEKIPEKVDITGEQISGDAATVFVKVPERHRRPRNHRISLSGDPCGGWKVVVRDRRARPVQPHRPSIVLSRRFGSQKRRRRRQTTHHKELKYCATASRFSRMSLHCPRRGFSRALPQMVRESL